jgi:hypothetical protein
MLIMEQAGMKLNSMLDWLLKRFGKKDMTPVKVEEDKRTLIYVYSKENQQYIFKKYGMEAPIYSVFCTKDLFYNSSLWFEMWQPSKEYLNK